MAEVGTIQKKRSEAEQYLQDLMAHTGPVDKLNRDDLVAEIAVSETVSNYCFTDGAASMRTIPCMDRITTRLKSDAPSFIDEFFQGKSESAKNTYRKMADAYLKSAEVYLGQRYDKNGYHAKTANIWMDFQVCFSLLPNWENLSFSEKLSKFFKKKQCEAKAPEHADLNPTRYNNCWHDRQPNGRSRYVCPGGYIAESEL